MNPARRTTAATATAVVLTTAGTLLTITPPASAATTCVSPVFKRQFFANTTFSGTPKRTDCDNAVDQTWSGAPVSGLPSNNFGVRWSVTRDFGSGGPFSLAASGLDGIRVYVDGVRKIDLWKNTTTTVSKSVNVTIPSGKHTLRVDYVNWTGSARVKFGYAPRTSATVDKVKPLVPAGTAVAYDPATGKATLTWAKNKEMDLAGYQVYRRLKDSGTWSRRTTTTGTSFTETLAKNGAGYYYEVRAYDKAGNVSTGSADRLVTTVDTTAPAAPTGVEDNWVMGYATDIKLYWDSNSEADLAGYRVYRSTSPTVALTAENLVATPAYSYHFGSVPQTGDWYYYVVTAVDTHGNESPASGTAEFMTEDKIGPVETAHNLRATEGEEGVTLTWDASEVSSGADFKGYAVLRSLKPRTESAPRELVAEGIRGTTAVDAAPAPGKTYYYWVAAVDWAGNAGPVSQDVAVPVAGNTTAPAAVTGVTATAQENGVSLSWDASTDAGLDHYLVYRGTLVDGSWVYKPLLHPADFKPWQVTGTTYKDLTPADGEQVRYVVVAVDQYGNQLSPETGATSVDVTELDLSPTVEDAPGGPFLHLNADGTGRVAWSLSAEHVSDVSDISAFTIYRWNRSSGKFELIGTEPGGTSGTGSWYDASVPKATTVYYRVTATWAADGTESAASETVVATYDN